MARRVIIGCDICETEPATSRQFGFDESKYEVDVCIEHGAALQDALQPYIDKGTEVVPEPMLPGLRSQRRATGTKSDPEQIKAIRAWAQTNNIKHKDNPVSDRGRIPQHIIDQYNSGH